MLEWLKTINTVLGAIIDYLLLSEHSTQCTATRAWKPPPHTGQHPEGAYLDDITLRRWRHKQSRRLRSALRWLASPDRSRSAESDAQAAWAVGHHAGRLFALRENSPYWAAKAIHGIHLHN